MPTYTGNSGDNVLIGTVGADTIYGRGGDDRIEGRAGADTLFGEEGQDVFIGADEDTIDGGAGYDTLILTDSVFDFVLRREGDLTVLDFGTHRTTLTGIERIVFAEGSFDAYYTGFFREQNVEFGTDGDDYFVGWTEADKMYGGAGNDRFYGGDGYDLLDGGAGYDVAEYRGARREYDASPDYISGGSFQSEPDKLISIEALEFYDGTLTFDPDSQAAQVMRLYDAALDRAPDQRGFEDLLDYLEAGNSLESLAAAFIGSPEFQDRFGDLTNEAYVDAMYRFSLDRAPDPEGYQFWVDQLEAGMTRQDLLIAFSECPEHRQLTQDRLDEGLWVANEYGHQIGRLYDTALDRLPDASGIAFAHALKTGSYSLVELAELFVQSQEFRDLYGEMSNQEFVEQMYRSAMDREGDAQGIANWTAQLDGGMSRAEVMVAFSESAEHVALTRDVWLGGVPLAGMTPEDDAFILPTWEEDVRAEVLPVLDDAAFTSSKGPQDGLAFLEVSPRFDPMVMDGLDMARSHDDRVDHDWMM